MEFDYINSDVTHASNFWVAADTHALSRDEISLLARYYVNYYRLRGCVRVADKFLTEAMLEKKTEDLVEDMGTYVVQRHIHGSFYFFWYIIRKIRATENVQVVTVKHVGHLDLQSRCASLISPALHQNVQVVAVKDVVHLDPQNRCPSSISPVLHQTPTNQQLVDEDDYGSIPPPIAHAFQKIIFYIANYFNQNIYRTYKPEVDRIVECSKSYAKRCGSYPNPKPVPHTMGDFYIPTSTDSKKRKGRT